ncbi:sugar kinase [Arthrobacter sp. MYb224]|uniref:ROK family protein n=1 Tax=Arthrobacter sp. MYb224 TaxID=1848600 RepID=UPI000CFBF64D|nr:ROK family protein [Arthrobacter sp. MYb224]PQZ98183.1 sugar kinase [Arthrobacter sp. MYb224]
MSEHFLLFDVGGTDIKAALADEHGQFLHVLREPTIVAGAELAAATLMRQLVELAARLRKLSGQTPLAAGLVVCGLVDAEHGIGIFSANLGWRRAPLRQMAEQALGLPVGFGHDVTLAARAELEFGSGAADPDLKRSTVVMIIGTGISSALLVDGRIVSSGGYAGELGHAQVPGGLDCKCGNTGCLETLGSAGAIASRYEQRTGRRGGAKEVFEARKAGDSAAAQVIADAIEALSFTLAQQCASIAPEGIVIGGGLAQAGDRFFEELQVALYARLSFHRKPRLVPAQLGANAGLRGSLILAQEASEKNQGKTP